MNGRPAATGGGDAGHPDPETLAAYADRALSPDERSAVERHVADCDICREVLADTLAFVSASAEPVPFQPKARRHWGTRGVIAGLAAAAALALAVRLVPLSWLSEWFAGGDEQPAFEQLVAAVGNEPTRPLEGRLTGGFRYAPPPAVTRGGETELSPDVRIAAGRIESAARDDASPSALHDLGVARLVLRDYDGAIAALERAANAEPSSAAFQNDLAAAYLARGGARGANSDLELARTAAERALTAAPDLPEALFNRALALDALASGEAADAWRAAAEREPQSPWGQEAVRRSTGAR